MNLPMLWIIPALPLAAVFLNLLFGDRLGKRGTTALACGAVLLAFVPVNRRRRGLCFKTACRTQAPRITPRRKHQTRQQQIGRAHV